VQKPGPLEIGTKVRHFGILVKRTPFFFQMDFCFAGVEKQRVIAVILPLNKVGLQTRYSGAFFVSRNTGLAE
jgi:hypothetical protein